MGLIMLILLALQATLTASLAYEGGSGFAVSFGLGLGAACLTFIAGAVGSAIGAKG